MSRRNKSKRSKRKSKKKAILANKQVVGAHERAMRTQERVDSLEDEGDSVDLEVQRVEAEVKRAEQKWRSIPSHATEEKRAARKAVLAALEARDAIADPQQRAWNKRWQAFQRGSYDERIAIFLKTLKEGPVMDEQMAFEMVHGLHYAIIRQADQSDWIRFNDLIKRLRKHVPQAYEPHGQHFLELSMGNALVASRDDMVLTLFDEMIESSDGRITHLENVLDQLAYHNQLDPLAKCMYGAWPKLEESDSELWDLHLFAKQSADFVILHYLEYMYPDGMGTSGLVSLLLYTYKTLEAEPLEQYLGYLTGEIESQWKLRDFKKTEESDWRIWNNLTGLVDQGVKNLYHLTVEFMGYLRREERFTYGKSYLAREGLYSYFVVRHANLLRKNLNVELFIRAMTSPRRRFDIVPDYATLRRYLKQMIEEHNQLYKAAATFEVIPAWLRFLESRKLIDSTKHQKKLQELQPLQDYFFEVLQGMPEDPILQQETLKIRF
ncbi:MAG: hypothetical protein ACPGWR_21680 [Ardenticatenaceae bacterium]